MKSGLRRGQLTKWKDKQGFGFIQPADGSKEVFLHISELKNAARRPHVGDTIYYYGMAKDGKIRAYNAFILGARIKPTPVVSTSPSLVLEVLLLSAVPLIGAIFFAWKSTNLIPLLVYPAMSLVTFALYADDKSRAQKGNWRISEKTLHLSELAGGWLGGFIAQRKLRHKCRKEEYQIVFWGIVIIHHIFWLGWLLSGNTIISWL